MPQETIRIVDLDQFFELVVSVRVKIARFDVVGRPGIFFQHLQQEEPAVAVKRPLAGQHFVEDHAEAIDIAASIDLVRSARGLL